MLDWGRQRSIYSGGFVQDDWKITQQPHLESRAALRTVHATVDARDLGSLFNIQNGQFALPGKNGYSRAIVEWRPQQFRPARRLRLAGHRRSWCCAAATDSSTASAIRTSRSRNSPATSRTCRWCRIAHASRRQNTVKPPYTINTPIPSVAASASLAAFTAANPFVGTIRSQAFDQARDPMLHQYNFNIQYQLTESLLLETSYSGVLGRDLSSMFINENQIPVRGGAAGQEQAGQPAVLRTSTAR